MTGNPAQTIKAQAKGTESKNDNGPFQKNQSRNREIAIVVA